MGPILGRSRESGMCRKALIPPLFTGYYVLANMALNFGSKIVQKKFDTKIRFWDSSHTHRNKTHSHMRTKTLLLTAALAAVGVSSSMAQVYSVNVVGYVNKSVPKGFYMLANQ